MGTRLYQVTCRALENAVVASLFIDVIFLSRVLWFSTTVSSSSISILYSHVSRRGSSELTVIPRVHCVESEASELNASALGSPPSVRYHPYALGKLLPIDTRIKFCCTCHFGEQLIIHVINTGEAIRSVHRSAKSIFYFVHRIKN